MSHDIDADADRDRRSGRPSSSADSSRMPASLAPAASTSFGHFSSKRLPSRALPPSRPIATRPFGTTASSASASASPATKPSVAASFSSPPATRSSVAARLPSRRRPGAAAPAAPAFLPLGDDPELARVTCPRVLQRHRVGGADRVMRLEPEAFRRRRSEPAETPSRQKNVLAAASAIGADRTADQHVEQHEGAGDAEHERAVRRPSARSRRPARRTT